MKNKQLLTLVILPLLLILTMSAISAKTIVAGKIYNADYSYTIADANVTVSCVHGSNTNVKNNQSLSEGTYSVLFPSADCNQGDSVTVSAVKGSLYGSKTGIVNVELPDSWDLAVVNVPLVPEFGVFVGVLTVLSAIGVFFIIRKN